MAGDAKIAAVLHAIRQEFTMNNEQLDRDQDLIERVVWLISQNVYEMESKQLKITALDLCRKIADLCSKRDDQP